MVTPAAPRQDKYKAKLVGDVIGARYDATKPAAVRQQKDYFARAEKLEEAVKRIIDGVPSFLQHFYIAYAEEISKHAGKFEAQTLLNEAEITTEKWTARGLDKGLLNRIRNLFFTAPFIETRSPGVVVDDPTIGVIAWTNPGNAKVEDGNVALAANFVAVRKISHYLKATNFGFTIPSDAIVLGILVEAKQSTAYSGIEEEIKIVKSDGTIGAENKSTGAAWPGWPTYLYVPYGGETDLWSEAWTPADINHANFGVVISGSVILGSLYVDHIRITIYYQ